MTQTLNPMIEITRDELGGTLADAILFVEGVQCTECSTEASETREHAAFQLTCYDCGQPGCRCILTEDAHRNDVFWCPDCETMCCCPGCMA